MELVAHLVVIPGALERKRGSADVQLDDGGGVWDCVGPPDVGRQFQVLAGRNWAARVVRRRHLDKRVSAVESVDVGAGPTDEKLMVPTTPTSGASMTMRYPPAGVLLQLKPVPCQMPLEVSSSATTVAP